MLYRKVSFDMDSPWPRTRGRGGARPGWGGWRGGWSGGRRAPGPQYTPRPGRGEPPDTPDRDQMRAMNKQILVFTFRDPGTRSSWCSRRLFLTDIGLSWDVKCLTQFMIFGRATRYSSSNSVLSYYDLDLGREEQCKSSNKSQTPLWRRVSCWYLLYKLIIKDIFFGDLSTTRRVQKLKSSYGKMLFC